MSELLPHTTIIHHDGSDLDFLLSEKIDQSDFVVVSTRSDETNGFLGMLAKEAGAKNVIIQLSNIAYLPIIQKLGIQHIASPRVVTANRIFALAFSSTLTSLVSLYENQAEIMEIKVSRESKIIGIPLRELGALFPQ